MVSAMAGEKAGGISVKTPWATSVTRRCSISVRDRSGMVPVPVPPSRISTRVMARGSGTWRMMRPPVGTTVAPVRKVGSGRAFTYSSQRCCSSSPRSTLTGVRRLLIKELAMRWVEDLENGLEKTQARLFQRVTALKVVRLDLSFRIGQGHQCHHGGLGPIHGHRVRTPSWRRQIIDVGSGKLEPLAWTTA